VHLAKEVAANGMVVVSGLARGIDSAAHKGALEGKGETWAVFGCGVDVVYPAENQRLADSILERGALLSEFTPGTTPEAQFFPPRNRLISGCARGVVVVEAAERSGALITVDFALEQGREVFAVPGPIFSAMSKGTHHLLRQGAMIAAGIEDILGEVRMNDQPPVGVQDREEADAGEEEGTDRGKIMALLSDLPLHIDQITLRSELTPENIALILLELELNGKVMPLPGQHFVLAR
jgi:DNA processing protein